MTFTRSDEGMRNSYLFYSKVLVWVEGDDDVVFYSFAVDQDKVLLKPAGGRPKCEMLADAIVERDLPYVVITDGDYELLRGKTRRSRRVIELRRYSIENYLAEPEVCEQVVRLLSAQMPDGSLSDGLIPELANEIDSSLRALICVDASLVMSGATDSAMPNRIDELLCTNDRCKLDHALVDRLLQNKKPLVNDQHYKEVEDLVGDYIRDRPITHLLRGHLLFGALRFFISRSVKAIANYRPTNDEALKAIFASVVWKHAIHADHRAFTRKLKAAVRQCALRLAQEK